MLRYNRNHTEGSKQVLHIPKSQPLTQNFAAKRNLCLSKFMFSASIFRFLVSYNFQLRSKLTHHLYYLPKHPQIRRIMEAVESCFFLLIEPQIIADYSVGDEPNILSFSASTIFLNIIMYCTAEAKLGMRYSKSWKVWFFYTQP